LARGFFDAVFFAGVRPLVEVVFLDGRFLAAADPDFVVRFGVRPLFFVADVFVLEVAFFADFAFWRVPAARFLAAPITAPETAPITVPTTGRPRAVPATAPATAPPSVLRAVPFVA
jgi:hypothetical protein